MCTNNTPTLTLVGASGASYAFNVYPLDTSFQPIAAVYAVTKRTASADGNGKHEVVYIGQTGNLPERFDDHHKARCFRSHTANRVCLHRESLESARLQIEKDLIACYNPVCNG